MKTKTEHEAIQELFEHDSKLRRHIGDDVYIHVMYDTVKNAIVGHYGHLSTNHTTSGQLDQSMFKITDAKLVKQSQLKQHVDGYSRFKCEIITVNDNTFKLTYRAYFKQDMRQTLSIEAGYFTTDCTPIKNLNTIKTRYMIQP